MLQFGGNVYNSTIRTAPYTFWRLSAVFLSNSTATNVESLPIAGKDEKKKNINFSGLINKTFNKKDATNKAAKFPKDFSYLQEITSNLISGDENLKKQIKSAKTAAEIIQLISLSSIDSKTLAQVMTTIRGWAKQPSQLDEKKPKLTHEIKHNIIANKKVLIEHYPINSLAEALQILTKLCSTSNRNLVLIKRVAEKINAERENLNIKQCADILYCAASLKYIDEEFLQGVVKTLITVIPENKKSAVIGSICTSLGVLRYRNQKLMEVLCQWAIDNKQNLRVQDSCSMLQTVAVIGHKSAVSQSFIKFLKETCKFENMVGLNEWIDYVWSLALIGEAESEHCNSVLNKEFLKNIQDSTYLNTAKQLKLLNINAATKCLKNYCGETLMAKSPIFKAHLTRSKDKIPYMNVLSETLLSTLPSSSHYKLSCDTKIGLFLDAECYFNSDNKPITIDEYNAEKEKNTRIAIIILFFNDFTSGENSINGINLFYRRILQAHGYKVLFIPYTKIQLTDSLFNRNKFISDAILSVVQGSSI